MKFRGFLSSPSPSNSRVDTIRTRWLSRFILAALLLGFLSGLLQCCRTSLLELPSHFVYLVTPKCRVGVQRLSCVLVAEHLLNELHVGPCSDCQRCCNMAKIMNAETHRSINSSANFEPHSVIPITIIYCFAASRLEHELVWAKILHKIADFVSEEFRKLPLPAPPQRCLSCSMRSTRAI